MAYDFKLDIEGITEELPHFMKKTVSRQIRYIFELIKSGKAIAEPYADSTVVKRRRYGLPTNRVRLYGSTPYDGRPYRLLSVKNVAWKHRKDRIFVTFKKTVDKQLWNIHRKRYKALQS